MSDLAGLVKRLNEAALAFDAARHNDGSPDEAALRDVGYHHGHKFRESALAIERLIALERRIAEAPVITLGDVILPKSHYGKRVRLLLEDDK